MLAYVTNRYALKLISITYNNVLEIYRHLAVRFRIKHLLA